MNLTLFQLKKFSLLQSNEVFKITTDSILLGCWCDVKNKTSSLDVGCGTGILSLLLAQRGLKQLSAIDINKEAIMLAQHNFKHSNLNVNFKVEVIEVAKYKGELVDLIICNPPYFVNSKKNETKNKTLARHQIEFSFKVLFSTSKALLKNNGLLAICVPFNLLKNTVIEAAAFGLFVKRQLHIKHLKNSNYSIALIEFTKELCNPEKSELVLFEENGLDRTDGFQNLIDDFLK